MNAVCTFQIILQFMDYSCILNKRYCIEVNFIVHSKFDIIPVLFCYRESAKSSFSIQRGILKNRINNTHHSNKVTKYVCISNILTEYSNYYTVDVIKKNC